MCFILYPECDRCRWPEIGNIRGVKLCETFEKVVLDRDRRVAYAGENPSPQNLADWRCLGLYTFIRANGPQYDIWISRDCLRFSPEQVPYLCQHCKERDAELTAAFGLLADNPIDWADCVNLDAPVFGFVNQAAAVAGPAQPATTFDPAELETVSNMNWENLAQPGPSTRNSAVIADAQKPAVQVPNLFP
ncbi:hypothetical protein CBER1_00464 [Cercospora berteroae]|uniref:Uncharacterized protein n=1 Tax=Cercospora berteroae TaxID=357750 RepID=A0A2S6CBH5_9PEZI|nr:hypothetical protein CBER1_00464 [Cercospora berteroae]